MIQQYLTFILDSTLYAVNVFQVQEVLEYEKPTPIPCTSELMLGIIRSREKNIAVIDLRKKFSLKPKAPGKDTRIVVLEVKDLDNGLINFYGIVADNVVEVFDLDDENLEPYSGSKNDEASRFVTGVTLQENKYTFFLNVDRIFSQDEIDSFSGKPVIPEAKYAKIETGEQKPKTKKAKAPAKSKPTAKEKAKPADKPKSAVKKKSSAEKEKAPVKTGSLLKTAEIKRNEGGNRRKKTQAK